MRFGYRFLKFLSIAVVSLQLFSIILSRRFSIFLNKIKYKLLTNYNYLNSFSTAQCPSYGLQFVGQKQRCASKTKSTNATMASLVISNNN